MYILPTRHQSQSTNGGILAALFGAALMLCGSAHAYTLDDALREQQNFNYAASLNILESLGSRPDIAYHRAWVHLMNGDEDMALDIFDRLTEGDYRTAFGAALACVLKKDYTRAEKYLERCLKINPKCAIGEYVWGTIRSEQGDKEGAVRHYTSALKLDYNLTEAKLKRARLYQEMNKHNEAFREWAHLADIDPGLQEAQQQKKNLLARITKKPEEIIQPFKISEASVLAAAPEAAQIPLLRIGILKNVREFSFWSKGGFLIRDDRGTILRSSADDELRISSSSELFQNGRKITIIPQPEHTGVIVRNIKYAEGYAWAGTSDREYRGIMEVRLSTAGIALINIVNLEEYLYSVLPSEMIAWWPEEALKVQAVIARNQALYRKQVSRPHSKDNVDLCDGQHCQVYKGVKQETSTARKMVDATRGEILEYNGKIVHTLFSSNCGGHTQSSKELKGWGDEPFLVGTPDSEAPFPATLSGYDQWVKTVPDIYCAPSKYTYYAESRWVRLISQEELAERINRRHTVGAIKRIVPLKRARSGHINHIRIEGTTGSIEIEKENLIRGLALGKLRSTNFIVEGYGAHPSGAPAFFLFWGAGWGHGVGLCQSGVAGMSEKGFAYDAILKKYFRGSVIRKLKY